MCYNKIGDNMDNITNSNETLRQYLTYNKDPEIIENIFYNLDLQMQYLHGQGYYVNELNSDAIIFRSNNSFVFASINKGRDISKERHDNIVDFAKLFMGAYISIENGFCDYSCLDTNYIKKNFDSIKWLIPNSEYFEDVIVNDDTSMYYNTYINKLSGNSKGNSRQMVKATVQGKLYSYDEDSAFVKIIFYPVMLVSFIVIILLLYVIVNL